MKRLWLLFFFYATPCFSNPIGGFTTGTMSSTTVSSSSTIETIVSKDYNTGFSYTVSGSGITHDGGNMSMDAIQISGTTDGVSYKWTGQDFTTKPNWSLTNPTSGDAFQFVESYSSPGLSNVTSLTREQNTQTTTTSTSIFTK